MSFHRGKLIIPALLVSVSAVVAYFAFWRPKGDPPVRRIQPADKVDKTASSELLHKPEHPPQGYVGSKACKECHAEICKSYESHPMAHSLTATSHASALEDYKDQTTFSIPGQVQYRVERKDDGVFHHEKKTDSQGQVLYDQGVQVHYSVGSGKRGRTYLIEQDGKLFESPITWYSGRKRWDLSPGYYYTNNKRFERRIVDGCVVCHAGRTNFDSKRENTYRQPVFLEHSIGCERCHGPGREHIQFRRKAPGQGADLIVNPVKLDPLRRDAVCNQCHLHGESKILRYGRGHFDFRPGMHLEDVWTVFVRGAEVGEDGRTKAVSQVQQMHASACFQKSQGRMGCISCHDPHRSPPPSERTAFYRKKCMQCHSIDQKSDCQIPIVQRRKSPNGNSCSACHMPKLDADDVPHTSQTDHRVIRKPFKGKNQNSQVAAEIFNGGATRLPAISVKRARGLFLAEKSEDHKSVTLATRALKMLKEVEAAAPDDVEVLRAIGMVHKSLNETENARLYWERAIKIMPENESVLRHLAILAHDTGKPRAGIAYLNRLLALNRNQSDLYGRQAHMLGQIGEFRLGIDSAKMAIAINPTMEQVHVWLSSAYGKLGNTMLSEYHKRQARMLSKQP